jgi:O-antigen/teichoic acid export membrane protein
MLDPQQYGKWANIQVFIAFLIPFIGINAATKVTKKFFTENKENLRKIIGNVINLSFINTILFFIGFFVLSFYKKYIFGISIIYFVFLPVLVLFLLINTLNLTILRNRECPKIYAIFEIGPTITYLLITIILLNYFNKSWNSLFFGYALSYVIFGITSLLYLNHSRYLCMKFEIKTIFNIVKFCFPLVFHASSVVIVNLSDRIFVEVMAGTYQVGIYAVGYSLGSVMLLFTDSFNKVWSPYLYKNLSMPKFNKRKTVIMTYSYIIGVVLLAFIIFFMCEIFAKFYIDRAFLGALPYVFWISLGFAFQGMYFMVFPYQVYAGKTGYIGFITGSVAIINMIGNYIFIKMNGPVGAAQSTALSYFFLFLFVWKFSQSCYPLPWFRAINFRSAESL